MVSVAIAVLTAVAVFAVSYLVFPVTGVEIRGARMFPESKAWRAVPDQAGLLTLNSGAVERRIESNAWVENSEVTKNWGSGIVTVEVEERRAVLNGDLGGRRIVVAADGTKLPGLGGADLREVGLHEDQLERIVEVERVLDGNGVVLESVDSVGAGGIEATADGREVVFSADVTGDQARALRYLMREHPDAARFDLRSPERVVVGDAGPEGLLPEGASGGPTDAESDG